MFRILTWLLAVIGTVALAAQNADVERAWDLAAKGERAEAIEVLHRVIERNPSNADARLLVGSLLSEGGNAPEAIDQLNAAVRLRPQSADAQNALGEAYNAAGDPKAARTPFERAVRLNPAFAVGQLNLGSVLLQAGDYSAAAEHLDRAIALLGKDADAPYARYLRAKVYSASGDPKSAARQLEQAVALRPNYPEAWSDLGQARKLLLDDAAALAAETRAVELNPADAVAQYRLGAELLRQDRAQAAVDHLQEAYRLNPEDQSTLNALQSALRQAGKTDEANSLKAKLTQLLRQKDQANQNALEAVKLNNQGAELDKTGDFRGALEKYRQAVDLYPTHVGMRVNYAVALLRLGHWTEGLDEMHRALEREPGNDTIRAALKDALRQAPAGTIPNWNPLNK